MDPIRATVKWFSGSFGFLAADDGKDYFVHFSAIEDANAPDGSNCNRCDLAWRQPVECCPNCGGEVIAIKYKWLSELQEVEILSVIDQGERGLKAARVRKL